MRYRIKKEPERVDLKMSFHGRFTHPLSAIVLLLIGLPPVIRSERLSRNRVLGIAISLAIGLGIQVTLFVLFRAPHLRGRKKTAAKSSMAASGGVSVVAMMACCSHYLATLIPLLGVSFLSATAVASLAQYQPYFFLAGLLSCLLGIALMARMMRRHGMFKARISDERLRLKPGRMGNI